jgi:hypothetical protein
MSNILLRKLIVLVIIIAAISMISISEAKATPFLVEVFSEYTKDSNDGSPFYNADLVKSYYTDWDYDKNYFYMAQNGKAWEDHWFPLEDDISFGARLTGSFYAANDGKYDFFTWSDDGSAMYIDGVLVVGNGGDHSPKTAYTSAYPITAGLHSITINFYEEWGGNSCITAAIDGALQPSPVPEPSTIILLISGLMSASFFRKKTK